MKGRERRLVVDGRRLVAGRTGVGRYLESLLSEWARSEMPAPDIVVALSDDSGLELVPKVAGMTARVVSPGLPGLLWERFGLSRLLRPDDLLFAPTNLVPWGWRGQTILVFFDALQETRPGDFPRVLRWRFGSRYRLALRKAHRIIVPSETTAADLVRLYRIARERLVVIYPSADRSFQPLGRTDPQFVATGVEARLSGRSFFLFVGKKSKRRNIEAIHEAFRQTRLRLPDHSLVFVGESVPGAVANLPDQPGHLDLGYVSETTLRWLLTSATALLYPSEHEGFGLPIVEAMASGCPVITLKREALLEAGGIGPIYLENAAPALLAEAMIEMATNSIARAARVEAGLRSASRFSPQTFAAAVRRELQEALQS